RIEQKDLELVIYADDDFKVGQVREVLLNKLAKRNVDLRFLEKGKEEKISGDKLKQFNTIKKGVTGDLAKKIVRIIKDSKLRGQARIQADTVSVAGARRDVLQEVMALLKKEVAAAPLSFNNFRD